MSWRRWSHAWNLALYGPQGFYRTQSPADHFATSVCGVPGTANALADALVQFMDRHGLSTFADLGAGNGTLTAALATHPHLSAIGIDVHARPPAPPAEVGDWTHGWDRVKWIEVGSAHGSARSGTSSLRRHLRTLRDALLFAHEWLDAVPCEIAELGSDRQLHYVLYNPRSGAERLGELIHEADLAWCRQYWHPAELAIGDRLEIGLSRDLRWREVTESLGSGVVVVVDYGHTAGNRPPGGSLIGYRRGRAVRPVPDGSCDLTAHVAMDSLGAPVLIDQRTALQDLGVSANPPDPATAAGDPVAYLAELARSAAGAALLGPGYGDALWAIAPVRPRAYGAASSRSGSETAGPLG